MKVESKSTAEISAAATPPTSAGKLIPTACTASAADSRSGRDHRRPSPAHIAEDGLAARPTSIQAPPPIQPGEVCSMAATRNVPAMM
ncbi:hypothetical protein SHL15_6655 [Streptomyces hygroscopicus subsp. limoneus]|nr:hypothetical protein SHL15_6655 [Streptomyces hygroscopicus subsp. limoneus]